jgi:hypothetical protein
MMSKNTPHDISPKPLNIAGLVLAVVAVVVAVAGIIIRFSHTDDLQKEAPDGFQHPETDFAC